MLPSSKKPAIELPTGSAVTMLAERTQLDFELNFFAVILQRIPDYIDVLRVHANNLGAKGLLKESLKLDLKLSELCPRDADVQYNLACRYAQLQQPDLAIESLLHAVDLGFRDFRSILQDRDLEPIRKDPRFRKLLRDYSTR